MKTVKIKVICPICNGEGKTHMWNIYGGTECEVCKGKGKIWKIFDAYDVKVEEKT
jgi:DnaJ-class molecular chaperone